jgi:hypothetical protein
MGAVSGVNSFLIKCETIERTAMAEWDFFRLGELHEKEPIGDIDLFRDTPK